MSDKLHQLVVRCDKLKEGLIKFIMSWILL